MKIFIYILGLLKTLEAFKVIVTVHVLGHTGKTCYFFYEQVHVNLFNIAFWVIVVFFYIAQVVWKCNPEKYPELKTPYRILEIGLHVIFNGLFIYFGFKHNHLDIMAFEIGIYWAIELMFYIKRKISESDSGDDPSDTSDNTSSKHSDESSADAQVKIQNHITQNYKHVSYG